MITKQITNRFLLVFAIFASISTFAQSEVAAADLTQEWSLINQKEGINIYVRTETCKMGPIKKPLVYAFFKFENTTKETLDINFQAAVKYDSGCIGCQVGDVETTHLISIQGNSAKEGDCNFKEANLSSFINDPALTGRIFESISINTFKVN